MGACGWHRIGYSGGRGNESCVRDSEEVVMRIEKTVMQIPWTVLFLLLAVSLLSSSCSVLMVANRSSYRGDVSVIQLGVPRSAVIGELGQPDNFTTLDNGGYDDRYVLDPDAHRGSTRFLTGLFYLGGDIFTVGLTELLFTPAEIAMKDRLVVYHLTYGADQKLVALEKQKS